MDGVFLKQGKSTQTMIQNQTIEKKSGLKY